MSRFTTDHPMVSQSSEFDKPPNVIRWLLLALTIGGGFTGLVVTVQAILESRLSLFGFLFCVVFVCLYIFVVASGLLFADNPRRTTPMIVAVILQIPWISSPMLTYNFSAGGQAVVELVGWHFSTDWRFGSGWFASFLREQPWGIGINFFAVLVLVLLLRYMRPPNTALEPTPTAP